MTDQALDDLARRVILDAARLEYGDWIDELPEQDFSPEFETKMKKLVRRANHPIRYRVVQTAACILLAALLSGCTALAISPEAREAFVGWVRDVYETWFVYHYTGEEQPTPENMVYVPTWVPEGYEEIAAPQVGTFVRTQYENGEKDLLTVSYLKGTETSSLNVEWEGAVVQQTSVGRLLADLYLNPDNGPNILVWTDMKKDAAFWITAPLPEEELVRVAESIQESGPMPKRYCISLLPMNYGAYVDVSATEEYGYSELIFENEQGFFITFGYSNDPADAPSPSEEATPIYVGNRAGALYSAPEDGRDKTLLWAEEDGTVLWVQAPLPDEDLLLVAENVVVQLNGFTDLIESQPFNTEAPLLERVEQALTDSFVAQVEDRARQDAQTGNYMSEEFNELWQNQQTQYVSPERDDAIARVSALADALRQEDRQSSENIVSLFGPFYTARIRVNKIDDEAYEMLAGLDLIDGYLEYYYDTIAVIVDERGMEIAGYHVKYSNGSGESYSVPTTEEIQFSYAARQIYIEAYQKALSTLSN